MIIAGSHGYHPTFDIRSHRRVLSEPAARGEDMHKTWALTPDSGDSDTETCGTDMVS